MSFPSGNRTTTAGLVTNFSLQPGEKKEVVFLLTWHFAGGEHGRMYGNWFADALAVAHYLKDNLDRLRKLTHLFHETYFDSTLPRWLLARLLMPISTLATNTVQWRRNGRFWAWEGVGCCDGTCTHVWNYAQGMARLFPELERSARVMQDLGVGFDRKTGRVGFRGENPSQPYAADGQCGTVLKCYREHLMSKDDRFLKEHWPKIKLVMEYEIGHDGNDDGIIADKQWNTFDLAFVGPNTFVGALYLAALRAAARMADIVGDRPFAKRCREIAAKGSRWTVDNLWNGEYFEQRIPPGESPNLQYGNGMPGRSTVRPDVGQPGRTGCALSARSDPHGAEIGLPLQLGSRYRRAERRPSSAAVVCPPRRRRSIHLHLAQRGPHGRARPVSRRGLDGNRIPGRLRACSTRG